MTTIDECLNCGHSESHQWTVSERDPDTGYIDADYVCTFPRCGCTEPAYPEQCCGERCERPATRKDQQGNTYCALHEYLAAIAGLQAFRVNASEHEMARDRRQLNDAAAEMLVQLENEGERE